jgi:hypothetical protein
MMETIMDKTKNQMWADWVATQSVDHFQETLGAATEDGKYKILAQLLSSEPYKIRLKPPMLGSTERIIFQRLKGSASRPRSS